MCSPQSNSDERRHSINYCQSFFIVYRYFMADERGELGMVELSIYSDFANARREAFSPPRPLTHSPPRRSRSERFLLEQLEYLIAQMELLFVQRSHLPFHSATDRQVLDESWVVQ